MSRKVCHHCKQRKPDCFAFGDYGVCKALIFADFDGKPCPFYKTKAQRWDEHVCSIRRLENINRCDLIVTYGETIDQRKVWAEIEMPADEAEEE